MNRVFFSLALLLCTSLLHSQITIGSSAPPSEGALLDLKTSDGDGVNSTKGLLLPRVQLESKTKLLPTAGDQLEEHIGLTVYNLGPAAECIFSSIKSGVYVWSGLEWHALAGNAGTADPGVAANAQIYRDKLNGSVITGQALALTVGGSTRLVAHADGDDLSYVWYKEGTTPPTAKNSDGSFVLANLQLTDQGVYNCRIYDSCDEYITRSVTINIEAVTCKPVTFSSISLPDVKEVIPVAPNTYNIDLWTLEVEGNNFVAYMYIDLGVPKGVSSTGITVDWMLDGVECPTKYMSLRFKKEELKIGQSILTYVAKQDGCADQTGVIVLNIGYDCSKQDIDSYIVYDKDASPAKPTEPILHQDIYNSIEQVISSTGDITYKVAVNKEKLAIDNMIYVPFYKKYFMNDVVHTNEKPYEGVRELQNLPFAPEGGLKLEVPPVGETWTTVEKFYDKKTQCTYVATYEVKIADSDCELVAFTGFTASLSNDPADPFMEILNHQTSLNDFSVSLDIEQGIAVREGLSIFIILSVGDMSKIKLITITHPSYASHLDHGNGVFELNTTQVSSSADSLVYTIEIQSTDPSCPIIKKRFLVSARKKNPDD